MPARIDAWKTEISACEISEETREILAAVGWLSSRDDPRVREIKAPSATIIVQSSIKPDELAPAIGQAIDKATKAGRA
jgi:hypothetical protein